MLKAKFENSLRINRHIASNPYLEVLTATIADISNRQGSDALIDEYIQSLTSFLDNDNFSITGKDTNGFIQEVGEVLFYIECKNKGLILDRFPEKNYKTPDFKLSYNGSEYFFEVKTPSIVQGEFAVMRDLERSLESNVEIERQLSEGRRIATGISECQPYGNKPYSCGRVSAVIDTLLEKARGNIKKDQYSFGMTFLVIDLSMLNLYCSDNRTLRPMYVDDYMYPHAVTGELWMLAFGQQGMLILSTPEFEGKSAVEGQFRKLGILVDEEYKYISGVIPSVHSLGKPPFACGLYRHNDFMDWNDSSPDIINMLMKIHGSNWNDEQDMNGWGLRG